MNNFFERTVAGDLEAAGQHRFSRRIKKFDLRLLISDNNGVADARQRRSEALLAMAELLDEERDQQGHQRECDQPAYVVPGLQGEGKIAGQEDELNRDDAENGGKDPAWFPIEPRARENRGDEHQGVIRRDKSSQNQGN